MRKHSFRIVIPSEVEGSYSLAVRWRTLTARNGKHRFSEKVGGGASPKRLYEGGGKRGTKKISRCARNDSVEGCPYPTYPAKAVLRKYASRIVIPSEVEGSFSLAVRWRVSEKEKRETPYRGRAVLLLKGLTKEAGKGKNIKLHIIPIYKCYRIILYRKQTPFMKNTIYFLNLYF